MSGSTELHELVASQGDVRLAAERTQMSVQQLMAKLLENPAELQATIRSSMSLQLLDLMANLRVGLIAALGEMSPKEMIQLLGQVTDGFNELWAEPGMQQNNLINFPMVNGDSSAARDKLAGRLAQLVSTAEGN